MKDWEKHLFRALRRTLDFLIIWVNPFCIVLFGVSAGILSYNFTTLRESYPKWPGLFDFLESTGIFWAFLVFGLFTFAFSVLSALRNKSLKKLEEENESFRAQNAEVGNNIKMVFDGLLFNLSKKFPFQQNDQVRYSIYVRENGNNCFIPCGRYSTNPNFGGPGRTLIHGDEGCLAKGWEHSWHFDNNFDLNEENYKKRCVEDYNIPEQVYNNMKMKSRLYAAKRLDDAGGQSLAVIVIEALNPSLIDEDALKTTLEGVEQDYTQLIRTLQTHIPNPSDAYSKGL